MGRLRSVAAWQHPARSGRSEMNAMLHHSGCQVDKGFKMKKIRVLLSSAILSCVIPQAAKATPPPPKYVELTQEKIKQLGFEYRIWRKGEYSYIEMESPPRIHRTLHPHSTQVITYDLKGRLLQDSTSGASPKYLSVENRFNHQHVDISVRMVYCKRPVASCVDFGITSVSAFIKKNAKPGDLLPE